MDIKKFKCDECEDKVVETNFYRIITEKLNSKTGEYEPYRICKKCITSDYSFGIHSDRDRIHNTCKKYNLYYNDSIVDEVILNDKEYKLGDYLRIISSLRQYQGLKFKDSVFENISKEQNKKSDIDFINDDIEKVKGHIKYAIKQGDVNAHGKWLNSLRDAIELRDKLQGNKNYVVNINSVEIKDKINADEFLEQVLEIAKKQTML